MRQDAFDGFLLSEGHVLPDILICFFIEYEVPYQSIIWRHDDKQFGTTHRLHAESSFVFHILMEWADDMNGQLIFSTAKAVIKFAGKGVVLSVIIIADFSGFQDVIKNKLGKLV